MNLRKVWLAPLFLAALLAGSVACGDSSGGFSADANGFCDASCDFVAGCAGNIPGVESACLSVCDDQDFSGITEQEFQEAIDCIDNLSCSGDVGDCVI